VGPFPQLLLDTHDELMIDLFAGGGGASLGIEQATGRQVDVAINHDRTAVAMHRANHPQTRHLTSDVFEVDPREVTQGRPVGLLWASPDCTDHSKAKGGKPFRDSARKRRALAWVVTRWAGQVRPRVIMLENVEEFAQWGPLVGTSGELRRCPKRKGRTFRAWVRSLEQLGYVVEWRELRACDYGAPTIRKRLFIIARCDGKPIVWPKPTHGPKTRKAYRTAASCIDWSIPMLSIFATREEAKVWGREHGQAAPKRPLAEATMRRIARGVQRFVLEAAEPFIVSFRGDSAGSAIGDPLGTITANSYVKRPGGAAPIGVVAPYLVPRYGERAGQEPRARSADAPAPVIVPTANGASLAAAFLAKHYGGHETPGAPLDRSFSTLTTQDHHHLVAAHVQRDFGTSIGHDARDPLHTITSDFGGHAAFVASFLQRYHGQGIGSALDEPASTLTAKDRLGLVTVMIAGEPYVIVDIAMRMLQPHELFAAQGFHAGYQIRAGRDEFGQPVIFTKTQQVRLVGNSVVPQCAQAIVRANLPELRARDEVAA
jgi:DNA (cytosine-5)-methyltransferase 1